MDEIEWGLQYAGSQAGYYPAISRRRRAAAERAMRAGGASPAPRIFGADTGAPGLLGGCGGDPEEAARRRRLAYPGEGMLP